MINCEEQNSQQEFDLQNIPSEKKIGCLIALSYLIFPVALVTYPIYWYHKRQADSDKKNTQK